MSILSAYKSSKFEKRQHPVDAVAIVRSSEPPGATPVAISALIPEEQRREERPFVVPFEEPHLSKSEEPEKPKEIDPREAEKVLQLLQEYDLEVNIPEQARRVREHRSSPSPHGDDAAQRGASRLDRSIQSELLHFERSWAAPEGSLSYATSLIQLLH